MKKTCINLLDRSDRYEHMKRQFQESKHFNDCNFLRVERHPKGGRYGCFDSHILAIRDAYNSGADFALICEDDWMFRKNSFRTIDDRIDELFRFIHAYSPDIVFCHKRGVLYIGKKVIKHCYEAIMITCSMYVVSRRVMKIILDEYSKYIDSIHFDLFLNVLRLEGKLKMYFFNPLVKSVPFSSDNSSWSKDILILQLLQKMQSISTIPEEIIFYYYPIFFDTSEKEINNKLMNEYKNAM